MKIGPYEVLLELGRGGMGTVYLARLSGAGGFERLVAIKRAHATALAQKDTAERFLREARLAASVHHANVVGIHQVGTDQEGHYLACDYVEGEALDRLIEGNGQPEPLPIEIALRIVLDALSGLHAAHETVDGQGNPLGILHRDVSIENLLVGRDGVTRLTDFGIAKSSSAPGLTDAGIIHGKLMYLTPEYLQGAPSQRRDDTYAMGVTLWIALSGAFPYRSRDNAALTREVLSRPIPTLSTVGVQVGPLLEACLARALSRDPEARFQTARALLDALEDVSRRETAAARQLDVADFVERAAGDKLAQRRAKIQASRAELEARTTARAQGPQARGSAHEQEREVHASVGAKNEAEGAASSAAPAASAVVFDTLQNVTIATTLKQTQRGWWIAALLVASAAFALWLFSTSANEVLTQRRPEAKETKPAAAPPVPLQVSPPEASAPSEQSGVAVHESSNEPSRDASAPMPSAPKERVKSARPRAASQPSGGSRAKPTPEPPVERPALDITTDNPYR